MTRTLSKYPVSVGTKLFLSNSSNNMWEWLSTVKIVESSVRLTLPREVGKYIGIGYFFQVPQLRESRQ
jgi:hypothetical protein